MQISRIRLSGKTSRFRPRHVVPKPAEAYETEVPVEVREWIAPAPAPPDLVLGAQPPAQPRSRVDVQRPVRAADGAYLEVVRPAAQRAVQTNSLLVLYDDAQNVYGATKRRKFSFAELGIQARGRTTILRLNYRNTAEVLAVAYEFAREELSPAEAEEDGIPLLSPESAGRHGKLPEIVRLPSFDGEVDYLVRAVRTFHDGGMRWGDIGVLYRDGFMGRKVAERLTNAEIPVNWVGRGEGQSAYRPDVDSVKLVTMHSSKGLEFPLVLIPGVGYMPHAKADAVEEVRLLYVAMTRAIDRLIVTCHAESRFAQQLTEAVRSSAVHDLSGKGPLRFQSAL